MPMSANRKDETKIIAEKANRKSNKIPGTRAHISNRSIIIG